MNGLCKFYEEIPKKLYTFVFHWTLNCHIWMRIVLSRVRSKIVSLTILWYHRRWWIYSKDFRFYSSRYNLLVSFFPEFLISWSIWEVSARSDSINSRGVIDTYLIGRDVMHFRIWSYLIFSVSRSCAFWEIIQWLFYVRFFAVSLGITNSLLINESIVTLPYYYSIILQLWYTLGEARNLRVALVYMEPVLLGPAITYTSVNKHIYSSERDSQPSDSRF